MGSLCPVDRHRASETRGTTRSTRLYTAAALTCALAAQATTLSAPFSRYRYVVAGLSNGPDLPDGALCRGAVNSCDGARSGTGSTAGPGRPPAGRRERRAQDGWAYLGTECRGDEPTEVVEPEVTRR